MTRKVDNNGRQYCDIRTYIYSSKDATTLNRTDHQSRFYVPRRGINGIA